MPKGPTKRRPQTRTRLIDAAFDVFAERGFHGASIEDICDRAGFTRGAFYSNFASKDELFLGLFDMHAKQALDRLRDIAPLEGVGDVFASAVAAAIRPSDDERRWYLITTEFTLYAIRDPAAARILAEHEGRLRNALAERLGDLYAQAGLEPTVDLHDLARLIVAVTEGAQAQSYVEPDKLVPGRLEGTFLPLILRAVAASRGEGPATDSKS